MEDMEQGREGETTLNQCSNQMEVALIDGVALIFT